MRKRDLGTAAGAGRGRALSSDHHAATKFITDAMMPLFSSHIFFSFPVSYKTLEGFFSSFVISLSLISPNLFCYNPQVMFSLTLTGQQGSEGFMMRH
jgi:hypothetical protein